MILTPEALSRKNREKCNLDADLRSKRSEVIPFLEDVDARRDDRKVWKKTMEGMKAFQQDWKDP